MGENMFFNYIFLRHMCQEINLLEDLQNEFKQIRYYNKEKLIIKTLDKCNKKEKYNDKEDYEFIIKGKRISINQTEFWDKWNENIELIIEGELE